MQSFIKDYDNNNNILLNNTSYVLEIICKFCETYDIDINLATYYLHNSSLETMYSEKYYEDLVNIGRYIVQHVLESIFKPLDIKPYEFCQIIN